MERNQQHRPLSACNATALVREIEANVAHAYRIAHQTYRTNAIQYTTNPRPFPAQAENDAYANLCERDGMTVAGEEKSVGTLIKEFAFDSVKRYMSLEYENKVAVINGFNSILDLSDSSANGQKKFLTSHWQDLKERFPQSICFEDLSADVITSFDELAKRAKVNIKQAYNSARKIESTSRDSDKQVIYSIYAEILKLLERPQSTVGQVDVMDTNNMTVKLWSRVFEALFEDSMLEMIWDMTVHTHPSDSVDPAGPDEKAHFNAELRLALSHENKQYDLAVVEFARYFEDSKTRQDHSKLLVESKIIVDSMIGMACPCDEIVVPCLQICGLHGDFLSLELAADGLYIAESVQTFCLPSGIHRLSQMKKLLACLVAFKAQVIRNKDILESYLNDDTFGQQQYAETNVARSWRRASWWPGNDNIPKRYR